MKNTIFSIIFGAIFFTGSPPNTSDMFAVNGGLASLTVTPAYAEDNSKNSKDSSSQNPQPAASGLVCACKTVKKVAEKAKKAREDADNAETEDEKARDDYDKAREHYDENKTSENKKALDEAGNAREDADNAKKEADKAEKDAEKKVSKANNRVAIAPCSCGKGIPAAYWKNVGGFVTPPGGSFPKAMRQIHGQ